MRRLALLDRQGGVCPACRGLFGDAELAHGVISGDQVLHAGCGEQAPSLPSTKRVRRQLRMLAAQHYLCPLCREPATEAQLADLTSDHVRPRSHGGEGLAGNLQLVHDRCNQARADQCDGCPACAGE
ncbi:HNH endonuclease [Streptomyces sp. NPDC058595]|uniref:HNH endonuclease n=1 Tax=Streptomyces sp. NPDC058595 TaxID=3346550 RepID=UPI0036498D8D